MVFGAPDLYLPFTDGIESSESTSAAAALIATLPTRVAQAAGTTAFASGPTTLPTAVASTAMILSTTFPPASGTAANVTPVGAATPSSGVSGVQQHNTDGTHRQLCRQGALIFTSRDLVRKSWSDMYRL